MNRIFLERALIFIGAIFYLFLFPHGIHGDATDRYNSLLTLLETGVVTPMTFSYIGPLVSAPLLLLGKLVKTEFWWLSRFNTLLFLGLLFYLWRFLRREFNEGQLRVVALLLLGATMFPKNVTDYYGETFCVTAMIIAIGSFIDGRFFIGAALCLLSVGNAPATIAAGSLFTVLFLLRERSSRYLFLIPLFVGLILLENYLKVGGFGFAQMKSMPGPSILPYAATPGFSYPFLFGLLSVLFSFGKGLLFFSPGLIAYFSPAASLVSPRLRALLFACLFYLIGMLPFYCRWWGWHGDWFWGPRYFLITSVMCVLLLAILLTHDRVSRPWKIFAFFAGALSFWVGCQGVLFGQDFLEDCSRRGTELSFICNYVPEYSVLWRTFFADPQIRGRKVAYLIYFILAAAAVLWRPGQDNFRWAWQWLRGYAKERWSGGPWRI